MAPPYHPPTVAIPPAKEAIVTKPENNARQGPWHPADAAPRGPWWELCGDPGLNRLEDQANVGNRTFAGTLAVYNQARAFAQEADSGLVNNAIDKKTILATTAQWSGHATGLLEIGGVRLQSPRSHTDHWRAGVSARSGNPGCHCRSAIVPSAMPGITPRYLQLFIGLKSERGFEHWMRPSDVRFRPKSEICLVGGEGCRSGLRWGTCPAYHGPAAGWRTVPPPSALRRKVCEPACGPSAVRESE